MSASSDLLLGEASQLLVNEYGDESPLLHSSGRSQSLSHSQRRASRGSVDKSRHQKSLQSTQSQSRLRESGESDTTEGERDSMYGPEPADSASRPSRLRTVAGFIVVTEFCERLAYYGLASSLVLFFQTQLGYSNQEADVQYSAWSGFCYVTPLLGGYIADTYLGRCSTILVFCAIYFVGLVLVVVAAIPGQVSAEFFFPAIYIIALGTGGIKPNVSTLGADQFDDRYRRDRREKESFFSWFYWSVNLGSLISNTLVAYICQYGIPALGGKEWGFFVGYSIPAIMMAVAIAVFVLGTSRYRVMLPKGSVLATFLMILYESFFVNTGPQNKSLKNVLDRAKVEHGGSFTSKQVEGAKLVTRLTPFLFAMVPFWGIYSQVSTTFQNQGCQMDLSMGSAKVPVSAIGCFDTLSILILVPTFDQVVYPWLTSKGFPLSVLQRMGLGFFCAILAMLTAAIVEINRRKFAPSPGDYYDLYARDHVSPCQNIDDYNPYKYQEYYSSLDDYQPVNCWQTCNSTYIDQGVTYLNLTCIGCDNIPQYSHMSVFWQVFQFTLIGTSEILAAISALEFFYSQSPTVMRSVTQSLNLATNALGSFFIIPLLLLVNINSDDEWVPTNLDTGHLDWYFFVLAGFMALTMGYFYWISVGYEYKTTRDLAVFEDTEETAGDESAFLAKEGTSAVDQTDDVQ